MSPIPFTLGPELIVKNLSIDLFDGSPVMLERGYSAPAYLYCAYDSDGNAQEAAGGLTPGGEAPAEGGRADQDPGMEDIVRTVTSEGPWDGYHNDVAQSFQSQENHFAQFFQPLETSLAAPQTLAMEDIVRTETSEGPWDGYHNDVAQSFQSQENHFAPCFQPLETSLAAPQTLAMDPQGADWCPAGPGAIAPRMPPPLEAPLTPTAPPTTPAAPSSPPMLPPMPRRPLGVELAVNGLHHMLRWAADAKKLKSSDTQIVSPEFELTFHREQAVKFQIVIRPTPKSTRNGGTSYKFNKVGGKGSIELCCRDAAPMIPRASFRFSVCSGKDFANPELPLGAQVSHDFKTTTTFRGQEEWDFERAVDDATKIFVVCLEIGP